MPLRKSLIAGVALAVALAPSALASSAGTPKPETMLKQVLTYDGLGQYGRAYDLLAPGQQKLINRTLFEDCYQKSLPSFDVVSFKVTARYSEPISVTGVPQHKSTAVTVRYVLRGGDGKKETDNSTWHAVWIGSRWAWVLSSADVAKLHGGNCI